jgi:hypothetical protein
MSELDHQMRSYSHLLNQAMGRDAHVFEGLLDLIDTEIVEVDRLKLGRFIRGCLEQHQLG